MSITVVGSVGLDTVETHAGKNIEGLGGAATYFALAAANFDSVELVAVVGEDFPDKHVALFESKNIGLEGLERVPGQTFRWAGRYHKDINFRDTLDTQLNVFAEFHPKVPDKAKGADYLFLGNIHPSLQLEVLEQTSPKFVALDTMNLWIDTTLDELKQVLGKVDAIVINDEEARQLTDEANVVHAARGVQAMGPRIVVVKKGEHGAIVFNERKDIFAIPALPLEDVVDPTGAGDSFAGGFMGTLAREGHEDVSAIRHAAVYGTVVASLTCEAFGPARLVEANLTLFNTRLEYLRKLCAF
ncbi:MAG: PfkB family carbohydrate kinase [Candidatus Hydrogenedentota bacterium]